MFGKVLHAIGVSILAVLFFGLFYLWAIIAAIEHAG